MYTKSTCYYDVLYHFKDYSSHAVKLHSAMHAAHPNASSLLEIACGTGRFLELLRGHYRVEGMDINPDMLAAARVRVPDIPLHLGSMIDFSLENKYDVVVCPFSSIAYVRTVENFFRTIHNLARHLAPGGILVIEPWFPPESYWTDRITMNVVQEPELKISWMYISKLIDGEAHLDYHFTVGTPRSIEYFTELHILGLFSRQHYEEAFRQAGLQLHHDPQGPAARGLYIGTPATH